MPTTKRLSATATVIVAVWLTATGLGHVFNPCITVGVASIGMATVSVAMHRDLFVRLFRPTLSRIAVGLAAGALMIGATYVLFPIITRFIPATYTATKALYGLMQIPRSVTGLTLALILTILTLIIAGEEILWRGVLHETLASKLHPAVAVGLGAVIYGLSHAPLGSPLLVAVAVLCGIYWSTLRWKTDSLIPSLIAHLMWDFAIVLHPVYH